MKWKLIYKEASHMKQSDKYYRKWTKDRRGEHVYSAGLNMQERHSNTEGKTLCILICQD